MAQQVRPGDQRLDLPSFEEEEEPIPSFQPPAHEPGTILPPLQMPDAGRPGTDVLEGGRRILLRGIDVTGNTVLPDDEIRGIAAPYVGREISFADLQSLRDALTLAYIDAGYVTSGATIPDQTLTDGVLQVRIVEGTLVDLDIETDGRLRPGYVRQRLERGIESPVNVNTLEEQLQVLQQDDLIASVQAALLPGKRRGESRLRLRVNESTPWWVAFEGNNYQTPAIGEAGGSAELGYANLTGFGDTIWARYLGSEGLNEVQARYAVPFTPYDTRFEIHMERTWSDVVEKPFESLDIESNTQTYGFTIRQPVYHSLSSRVESYFTGEWRRSKTYLLGHGFAFAPGPSSDGVAKMTVLRGGLEWTYRSRSQVFAARSLASWGIDALGATKNGGDTPDGLFFAWLGQIQWARRLAFLDAQGSARFDVQLATSPLLGLEQFAVGGHSTVRGYRENTLVRDNGLVGSVEVRVPVWKRSEGIPILELGPFVDVGYSWNHPRGDNDTIGPSTLLGVGVALRAHINRWARFEASWAHQVKSVRDSPDWNLQDDGVYLGLRVSLP